MLRNKLLYLCLVAYGIIFCVLYNEYITLLLLLALICIPAVLLGMLLLTCPFLTAEPLEEASCASKNTDFTASFLIKNRSIFPVAEGKLELCYYNRYGIHKSRKKIPVFVGGRSEQLVSLTISAPHCGNIILECSGIRLYDYLRIFSWRKKVNKHTTISVSSDFNELQMELPPKCPSDDISSEAYSSMKAGDDPSEVFSIREYRDGDRIHRIHWKLSSKRMQYMVKEFSLPLGCSAVILLDFCYSGSQNNVCRFMDQAIEKALSLSLTFIRYEYIHYFAWLDFRSMELRRETIETEDDLGYVMSQLFLVDCYKEKNIFPRAYAAMNYGLSSLPYYYVGESGAEGFEEYGIHPEVVNCSDKEEEIVQT